jgi:hypothetical protein
MKNFQEFSRIFKNTQRNDNCLTLDFSIQIKLNFYN